MTLTINLMNGAYPVQLDPRTAFLGGSFNPGDCEVYSPLPLKWAYDQLIRYPSAVLLDVGACTGSFTLLSAHHPDLKVHAFEPVPLTCEVLRQNVVLNHLESKVIANQLGVSNYNGHGIMHVVIDDGGKGVSILDGVPAVHKNTEVVSVEVVTIDTYCALKDIAPSLIKIDVEGQEQWVLEGAKETILKYHPFLLFEYSQENADQFGLTALDTLEMIEEWGYTWVSDGIDVQAVAVGWEILVNRGIK